MRTTTLVLLALLDGCASFSSADCGSDRYAIGERDGRLGAAPQARLYAARCGVAVDEQRYSDGWREGFSERPVPLW